MLRAFYNRHSAYDKWFYDKSVWQKMFHTMSGCGFNAMVMGCGDIACACDASGRSGTWEADPELTESYQDMRKWVLENALDYEILPILSVPWDMTMEACSNYIRSAFEVHPEFAGVIADAYQCEDAQAIVDVVDAIRPDAVVYLRGPHLYAKDIVEGVKRRGDRRIVYVAGYYCRHSLVDENSDMWFKTWSEAAGAENIAVEIYPGNFHPWTSFSFDTAEGIVSNLQEMGCDGLLLRPLGGWPHVTDTCFKFAWQRDLVWYNVWGGTSVRQQIREGQPKWLARNQKLVPGFQAGSRILELLALYFDGGPQFWSPIGLHKLTIEKMLRWRSDYWTQVTGDRVVHLAEYIESGTPEDAYGPEELIEELTDLSAQAIEAGEKGLRSASGEKELPSFSRDAFCMGRLGEFYIERIRAALSHARGEDSEADEHLTRALGFYREIEAVDTSHRDGNPWASTIKALETELEDARKGEFKRGSEHAT